MGWSRGFLRLPVAQARPREDRFRRACVREHGDPLGGELLRLLRLRQRHLGSHEIAPRAPVKADPAEQEARAESEDDPGGPDHAAPRASNPRPPRSMMSVDRATTTGTSSWRG